MSEKPEAIDHIYDHAFCSRCGTYFIHDNSSPHTTICPDCLSLIGWINRKDAQNKQDAKLRNLIRPDHCNGGYYYLCTQECDTCACNIHNPQK